MRTKSLVLLAMAVGCGLVAMLGVQQILSGEKSQEKDTVPVLVAKQDISPGLKLDSSQVAFENWPKDAVPVGAVTDPSQYEDRALKVRAYPGDPILQAKLGEKGEYGASTSIRKGLRVVTVPVNMTTVHSGMIRPGDRVDVLVTYTIRAPGKADITRTKTVLEYIEVFAIDRVREGEGSDSAKGAKAENLSVLVTPEQAHVLMLASNRGKLQMALRNSSDKDQSKAVAVDDKMFDDMNTGKGKEPETTPAAPPPEPKKVNPDFKKFVESAAPKAEPVEEEWAIEIFEGENRRVEKIKLPRPGEPAAELPAAATPPAPPPQEEEISLVEPV